MSEHSVAATRERVQAALWGQVYVRSLECGCRILLARIPNHSNAPVTAVAVAVDDAVGGRDGQT